jgi:hypothetical protein
MRAAVGRALAGGTKDARLQFVDLEPWLSTLMPGIEALQPVAQEASTPALDESLAAVDLVFNRGVGQPVGEEQDDPGPLAILSTKSARPRTGLKFFAFGLTKNDGRS